MTVKIKTKIELIRELDSKRREAIKIINSDYRRQVDHLRSECNHEYNEWSLCPYTGLFASQLLERSCALCQKRITKLANPPHER